MFEPSVIVVYELYEYMSKHSGNNTVSSVCKLLNGVILL